MQTIPYLSPDIQLVQAAAISLHFCKNIALFQIYITKMKGDLCKFCRASAKSPAKDDAEITWLGSLETHLS